MALEYAPPSPIVRAMLFFAVSVMAKLEAIPRKSLLNLGLAILVVIVGVFVLKQAAKMNRVVLCAVVVATVVVVCSTWVYDRNEPKFLTPIVNKVAPFFPHRPRTHW